MGLFDQFSFQWLKCFILLLGRLLGIPLVCADKFSLVYGLAFDPSPSAWSYPLHIKSPLSSYCDCFYSMTPWHPICWLLKERIWKGGYCALLCAPCAKLCSFLHRISVACLHDTELFQECKL